MFSIRLVFIILAIMCLILILLGDPSQESFRIFIAIYVLVVLPLLCIAIDID